MTSSAEFLSIGPIDAFPSTRLAAKELKKTFPEISNIHILETNLSSTLKKTRVSKTHPAAKQATSR